MEWQFDILQSGNIEGWNHSGLAHFRAAALSNLVRETLQNSLDNPHKDNEEFQPVIVRFIEHKIERENIPGILDLEQQLKACRADAANSNDEAKKGIKDALELSKRPVLNVLEVADFHTTGMPGPAVRHRPFHNYLKTSGDSTPDASRGGSHGLGKFAPLANTPLRTIFVSTRWDEGDEEKALFQGLTFLAGRENPDGTSIGQKGFWGEPNFMPIEQVPEEFSWMQREAVGTSIYLIGWDSPERWDALVLGHALINFFAAFQRRKLVVSVKKPGAKEITIGDDNDFAKYFGIEAIRIALSKDTDDALERLNRSQYYLKCIDGSDEIISQDTQVNPGIEASKVSLFKDDEAPQKIAFIRNNILITDQIPYFYKQKSQQFENYVGVFEVVNNEGYKLLRRMENPSHTALSEDWLPLEERRKGKRALAALGQKLKDIVKDKLSIQADIDPGPIEILKEFFSDEAGEGADNLENEDINPTGKFKVTSQPPKFAPPPVINIADKEADEDVEISEDEPGTAGGAGTGGGGGGGGGGHGTGHGSGSGGTGNKGKQNRAKNVDSIKLKTKRVVSISGSKVTAVVVADKATTVKFTLQEIGADYFEELPVVSCSHGNSDKGAVSLAIGEGERLAVDFDCGREIVGGVKLLVREAS